MGRKGDSSPRSPPKCPPKHEYDEKLKMISLYSACGSCSCVGWKKPADFDEIKIEENCSWTDAVSFSSDCQGCGHPLEKHIEKVRELSNDLISRLATMVADVDVLYHRIQQEDDSDTKQVYYYLFRVLRKCVQNRCDLELDSPFGCPPFEQVPIAHILANFVALKNESASASAHESDFETAALISQCLSAWTLETPSTHHFRIAEMNHSRKVDDELSQYKIGYARWLQFCRTPTVCKSLPRHDMLAIFGRNFLRLVLPAFAEDLKRRLDQETDDSSQRERVMREVPGFLRDLETELSKKDTPLVDSKYAPKLPKGVKRPTALTISADYRPLNVDTTTAVQGLEPEEDMDAHDFI
uniref:PCAF N-terminal domain-containing protein n=1 Tax=Plectus sambesii TaxID=2011161 RepID=A0A914UZ37_9BILA